ncbi:serine protease [Clostridium sp. DJ247]|uniref:serine protease n=1 Tax=Clostridium sp. DJ247 TaxID=2726188 RepID=UPI00162AEF8C|nr:serine protease [Clostridium sp. DJ247]MBC2582568.1 serine protease [Clostridium sp. DJ247]
MKANADTKGVSLFSTPKILKGVKKDEMPIQFDIKEKSSSEYIDFIEKPVPLVSDNLKKLLQKYDKKIFFKPIVLCDRKQEKQDLYWLMVPDSIDCLSDKSEFNKDGTLKRLVIDKKKVGNFKIFKVNGIIEDLMLVRLDAAESILRRDFTGIKLKKVEKEN